ncbi:MAG: serine hydrolase domain-containing protein [Pseudomonadota bacterium]
MSLWLIGTAALAVQAAPDWAQRCEAAAAYSAARRGASLLILQDGRPVCERYAAGVDATTAIELYSGTKAFAGLLAAAAVTDGLLRLDEPVADTLPEWRNDPRKVKATIRQLLAMEAGLPSKIGVVPTYAEATAMPFNAEPGQRFQYGPAPMQVFGEVMRRKLAAAGREPDPLAYLEARLLRPLGVTSAVWRRGADGLPLLPQGASLTARDWARVGEFVRLKGRAEGRQLVDADTLAALFRPSPANPAYGLTWWLPHASDAADPVTASRDLHRRPELVPDDLVMAAGAGDQRLYVIPSRKLTIVRQAQVAPSDFARPIPRSALWSDTDFLLKVLLSNVNY